MAIVVLGAGGRLGQLLRPVFPVEALWHSRKDVDTEDTDTLCHALAQADAVICLAGATIGSARAMQLNVTLAVRVLDAAQAAGAGRVLLFSSAAVYGRASGLLSEDTPAGPVHPYGVAKLQIEAMAAQHSHPNTAIRLGNVAGADAILGGWKPGFSLDTLPDGTTPMRSYIGPMRLAQVLNDLCNALHLRTNINVAAPGVVEMGALLDAAGLAWSRRPATDQTIAHVQMDTTHLIEVTNFAAADRTAQGIVTGWQTTKAAQ
jgi:nucleoside-diphosphate-sugar epimerase